jgi:hypothetical protein
MEIDLIELLLEGKHGFEFQYYCERYFDAIYGTDFHRVAQDGNKGDGGKDGYLYERKEYFAISSRTDVETKMKQDFINCVTKNHNVEIFNFVTNRISTSEELALVDKLRIDNPYIRIVVTTHKHIAAEIRKMPINQIETILCRSLGFKEKTSIFFKEEEKRKISVTFRESMQNSYLYYIMIAFIFLSCIGVFSLFYNNEWAWKISMMAILCSITVFLYFNKERLKKTTFPHKILYLVMGDKFHVDEEVLFDEQTNVSIRRNAPWHFTFNRRSADCIKKGCCGKVYLYKSEKYNMIGRCEKDGINHIYKVDSNFYGELL